MTELLRDVETPSDAELISRVRGGDIAAYGELFARHKPAANRLARQLVRGLDSDDLVAEAFAKVLTVLRGGGGPDVAFRAYLLTAVRRLHIDRVRSGQRLQTTDDMTPFDPGVPFQDTAVSGFERGAAAKAFASLPERWQLVLWHLEVEGQKPADIAPLLGMSANSVSALAYRAREGLRQAFLTMHLSDTSETDCRWVNEHLGAFVRQGLSKRDAAKVQKHLDGCRRCSAMYLELDDVNSNLSGIIGPLLLGAAAAGYLASGGAGATVGVAAAFSKVKEVVVANGGAAAAAGIASAVAAAAVIAVVVTQGGGPTRNVVADPPAVATSSVPLTSSVPAGPTGSPSSLASPSSTLSPGASTAGPGTTPAPSSSTTVTGGPAAATPTPTFSLSPLPTAAPAGPAATAPSASEAPSTSASAGGSVPTSPSSAPASGSPSPGGSPATAGTPARVVGQPVLHADGTVTVAVRHARRADTVDVTLTSQDTTFRSAVGVEGCRIVGSRHILCRADASAEAQRSLRARSDRAVRVSGATRAPAVDNLSVRLPLAFPDSMVSDDIDVTASVRGVAGASASTGPRTFRPARTPSFDFVAPVLGAPAHTLAGDEDRYDVPTTAVLPPRVTGLVYTLGAPAHFRAAAGRGCTVGAGGRTLRCPKVTNGDPVTLPVAANGLTTSDQVSIRVSPARRFVDPSPGNNTAALTLRPGVDLGLKVSVAARIPLTGLGVLTGTLTGQREGLGSVAYTASPGTTFPPVTALANPGCTVDGARMTCPAVNRDVTLVLATDTSGVTPVTVSVAPSPPFEAVGTGSHSADVVVPGFNPDQPVYDFSLTSLDVSNQTLVPAAADAGTGNGGDSDRYTLAAQVGALPVSVQDVAFTVSEGFVFAAQTDLNCGVNPLASPSQLRCTGLAADGLVNLVVESTGPQERSHLATVTLVPAASFVDALPVNNTKTVTLHPGVDLKLAGLTSDASSGPEPGNVDDVHVVTGNLSGVRPGLGSISYALTGNATFGSPGDAGCSPGGTKLLTCTNPVNGAVTFQVVSDPSNSRAGTPITITTAPGSPFVQVSGNNQASRTTLAPRPSYDFTLDGLRLGDRTVVGDADVFTLSASVPVPADVHELTFGIDGGTFATDQAAGCRRVDVRRVTCGGLTGSSTVALRVSSASTFPHRVALSVAPATGYRDRAPGNNSAEISLTPGVDLHLGPLTPADPVPTRGDYQVSTVLTGVRSGPVSFEVSGAASVTATSCARVNATRVTCASPANGQTVRFTLTPTRPAARTAVTITASASPSLLELDDTDDSATTSLAPDVAITALSQRSSTLLYTAVRAQITGVPTGVTTLRLHLSGDDVGLTRLRFTSGAEGADGEGDVSCFTSSATGGALANGVDVTCTDVQKATGGSFYVDTRLARLPLATTDATFTVEAIGADEGTHTGNNRRIISLRW